jgi:hypothetical protein
MANSHSGDDLATVFGTGDVLVEAVDVSLVGGKHSWSLAVTSHTC